eukprot:c1596_g1_i1.p1 GENE.c1596_g1_i1~~c1596_g1_i1.p1  ORF type:complete len:124 (-),score=32.51 c1596_g1_i1:407-730(-)
MENNSPLANRTSRPSIVSVANSMAGYMDPEFEDQSSQRCCGCNCSKNVRALIAPLVLFSLITVAQTAGAMIAHSLALLADCMSMFLDSLTYAGNLFAEVYVHRDERV